MEKRKNSCILIKSFFIVMTVACVMLPFFCVVPVFADTGSIRYEITGSSTVTNSNNNNQSILYSYNVYFINDLDGYYGTVTYKYNKTSVTFNNGVPNFSTSTLTSTSTWFGSETILNGSYALTPSVSIVSYTVDGVIGDNSILSLNNFYISLRGSSTVTRNPSYLDSNTFSFTGLDNRITTIYWGFDRDIINGNYLVMKYSFLLDEENEHDDFDNFRFAYCDTTNVWRPIDCFYFIFSGMTMRTLVIYAPMYLISSYDQTYEWYFRLDHLDIDDCISCTYDYLGVIETLPEIVLNNSTYNDVDNFNNQVNSLQSSIDDFNEFEDNSMDQLDSALEDIEFNFSIDNTLPAVGNTLSYFKAVNESIFSIPYVKLILLILMLVVLVRLIL